MATRRLVGEGRAQYSSVCRRSLCVSDPTGRHASLVGQRCSGEQRPEALPGSWGRVGRSCRKGLSRVMRWALVPSGHWRALGGGPEGGGWK
jgi:hypothetical protein